MHAHLLADVRIKAQRLVRIGTSLIQKSYSVSSVETRPPCEAPENGQYSCERYVNGIFFLCGIVEFGFIERQSETRS